MSSEEQEGEDFSLNPEDVVRIIDLDDIPAVENRAEGDDEDNDEEDDAAAGGMEMETDQAMPGPMQDDARLTFSGHKEAVLCCQVNPANKDIVITGSQDDTATVWNTLDGSVLFHCTGHTDTVACVGYSQDGKLVASADMNGLLQVWQVDSGTLLWSFEAPDIEWLRWHPVAPVLLAGTKDGQVWMWKVPSGDCKTLAGHGSGTGCGCILPDGKHACVGYDDGVVKIWDLKSTETVANISGFEGHKSAVYCLDAHPNGNLIATGSDDMTAKVIHSTTGKVVASLQCGNLGLEEDQDDSVESVGFSTIHDHLATGTLSGRLEIWDLPTKTVRHRCPHSVGVVKLQWLQQSPLFVSAGLDGCVRQCDSRNGQLVRTWQGHSAGVMDFSLSGDESLLVTVSEDETAKVFDMSKPSAGVASR